MSRLMIQSRELQALVDLQQIIGPLIAKSISRDSNTVSSLKVLNSWQNLSIEISQLLLFLKEEQNLSENDYNDFRSSLDNLLSLMDGLVDSDLPTAPGAASSGPNTQDQRAVADEGEHSMLGHQKLETLVRRAAEHEDSTDSPLLFQLPTREDQSVEIEKAVTDFNVGNFVRRNTAEKLEDHGCGLVEISRHTKPRIGKHESDRDAVDESQAFTTTLLKVLTEKASRSKCGCVHAVRLQVRDPVPSESLYKGLKQQIFISRCRSPDEWQETYCEFVSPVTTPTLPEAKLKSVRNICKAIEKSSQNGRKLDFLVSTDSLLQDLARWELVKQPPLWPTLSLEDILCIDASQYKPGDKVILAVNLARALLRVHSGDLTLQEMKAKDIFFLYNPNNGTVSDWHDPYLACSLVPPPNQQKNGIGRPDKAEGPLRDANQNDTGIALKFPMLVSFAELLMEIALGRKMGPYDCRVDIALLAQIDPKDYTGEVVRMVGKDYVDVIIQCLVTSQSDAYDSDSDSDSEFDSDSDSDQDHDRGINTSPSLNRQEKKEKAKKDSSEAVERLCTDVLRAGVASLEKARTIFAPQTYPRFQFTVNKPNRPVASKTPESAGKTGGQLAAGQSFDDVRMNVSPTDQRVVWAKEFFDSAQVFYQSNIEFLPVTRDNRIRVAVLDTGVDETSNFWRGASRIRKIKGSPIRETKHFVGDSIDDELGHGTDVAAIISKIAPESDLYIAKISRGREAEGTQQIIEAIDWAVQHEVRIINMSFCLPRNPMNTRVRKKIDQVTTSKGVIFVAAASNYGNNESRGFPAKLWQVICVHAVDGNGNKSGMNPPPKPGFKNFGSLGVAIESEWDAAEAYMEGTSYAAPVATGMVSNVLRFVQYVRDKDLMTEEYYNEACSSRGMSNILGEMAERTSDGYDYIRPRWKLWAGTDTEQDVITKIKSALEKDMD
ncbi:hypothetical protein Daus18300_013470 [Diaporthe australafricana]|uniref:Peptidase S8/S53 domain-containing protein n=1 Tax=Diaporthe australafricana TaxID=127596 RepID=A0ABR3VYV8_9PEZI